MNYVDITVQFKVGGRKIKAKERGVRLDDDSVQISASNLAYGLVEEAWGLVYGD